MRVEHQKQDPESNRKTKKTGKSSVIIKKERAETEKEAGGTVKDTAKPDAKVAISDKAKEKAKEHLEQKHVDARQNPNDGSPAQIAHAETLLSHVNSGKLSESEKEAALKQIGEILAKYRQVQS